MKREEKITILTALEIAMNKCYHLAEKADTDEEKQYQWGQADGLHSASVFIATRPEKP